MLAAILLALSCIATMNTAVAQGYPGYPGYPEPRYPNGGYGYNYFSPGWDYLYNMWGWFRGGWYSNTQANYGNLQYDNRGYVRPL